MSNNVLPNLSEWFEVPASATIPANTPYCRATPSGVGYFFNKGMSADQTPEERLTDVTYYTEHKIEAPKETLEDVIREGIGGCYTPKQIAQAVEAFYAEQPKQPKQPKVIIDANDDEWRRNAVGTYDLWDRDLTGMILQDYTRERIESAYGIKEERN